jgi:predicted porin
MKKQLLALAVAGALAPAAAIAQSSVEIYGRAHLGIDQYRATGSSGNLGLAPQDFDGRLRVFDASSRVGFRVNESLGGGMRAFVVVESGVNIDTGSQQGQGGTNGSSGFWASRSSWLGLGGGWGDIRWGRQDVFYGNGIIQQAAANYINMAVDAIWTQHPVVAPGGRLSNVFSYNSPTMGGFNASVYFSPEAETGAFTGTGQSEQRLFALTARYSGGALRGQFDISKRDNIGNASGAEDTGWKVGLGWAYAPGSQISIVHGTLENERIVSPFATVPALAGVTQAEVDITTLHCEHMLGQWQLIAQYMFTSEVDTNLGEAADSRTRGITLAAKYFLSKRTGVYVSYNQYRNEENIWTDFGPGACLTSAPNCHLSAASAGADTRIIAIGVLHNF